MNHCSRVLFLLLLCLFCFSGPVGAQQTGSLSPQYLPLVFSNPLNESIFGVQVSSLSPERGADNLFTMGPRWVRRDGPLWSEVEPVEDGGYRWDAPSVQALEQEMILASANNVRLVLVMRGSPRWATTPYQADCAPINAAKYEKFARFMAEMVRRYSQPPYNVVFWEIGNEPDAYVFPNDSPFGCWGLTNDPYYGGRQYGEMLKVVAPAMRAANPTIQILNGGLLLDRPYDPATRTGLSARFLEGIFVVGAASSFDILSYHGYSFYNGTADGAVGPVDWKVGYLRKLMETYKVQKPLFNTEGALLCPEPTSECHEAQADAIGRLYARAIKDGLMGFTWYIYDSDAFRHTALIEPTNVTAGRPAYYAYRHAEAMLGHAVYINSVAGLPPDVEGYSFRRAATTVVVVWSNKPQIVAITLPLQAVIACTDRSGSPIECQNNGGSVSLMANSRPTFITYGGS